MLQAAANITPRGVYVCGNTTTTSGLTVTLTKEGGGSGNYALEAGALVLADQGNTIQLNKEGYIAWISRSKWSCSLVKVVIILCDN